jgi:hypothetical protein
VLQLRPDQVAACGDAATERFVQRCVSDVQTHWPHSAAVLGPERLVRRVHATIVLAARFSISGTAELLRLVNVAMALDDDFDPSPRHRWVEPYLADERLRHADRIERLSAHVRGHLRGEEGPA